MTKTKRNIRVNCKTKTKICATEWKNITETVAVRSQATPLTQDAPLAIALEGENVVVSHVEITSPIFSTKTIRPGSSAGSFRVDYDPAVKSVFVDYLN